MNQGKYVFSQLSEFLPQRVFDRIVEKYDGDKYVRHFSCWNQLLCMLFGQLTNRDSLRDLIITLEAHNKKSYHSTFIRNESYNIFSKELEKSLEKLNPQIHSIISVNHSISSTEYTALIIYESANI